MERIEARRGCVGNENIVQDIKNIKLHEIF